MNTLVFALSAVLCQAEEPTSLWQQNYTKAQQVAAQDKKSVAVFLTQGLNGIDTLIVGGLNSRARELLANNYVPVIVDTATPEGQQLARAFEIRDGQGLILSDRGGTYQAFWYEGKLSNQDLVRNLEKYANQTNVRITEVAGRAAMYPDQPPPVDAQGNPVRQVNQPGYINSSTPVDGQRRRGRLFQGRMNRRTTN